MHLESLGAGAAGDTAAEGSLDAQGVCTVLRREGVEGMRLFGRGEGLGSHAPIVGRGASTTQRARVRDLTRMGWSGYYVNLTRRRCVRLDFAVLGHTCSIPNKPRYHRFAVRMYGFHYY